MPGSSRRDVLRTVTLLSVAAGGGGASATSGNRSRVASRCTPKDACIPEGLAVLLVYTVDSLGASIGGAEVTVSPPVPQGLREPAGERCRTDWYGMAAISLASGTKYRVRIACQGFHTLELAEVSARSGGLQVVRVCLEVDPEQLE